ncbi:hypothetical protein [Sphingorhabdus sp. YGSMI21]|uniref:hypothetical protein n=1 Tax=Sphingorhabdus sp. YGSMI21 TaxID=2077182 RepID=UPI000C1ED3CA|nr:hypothetical protein [Sphingorhabdus sp. YGSMI21]ATW03043.1 hypothetical protein CHN51_05440 [Sphingorhabdus sp. YGSMI21]
MADAAEHLDIGRVLNNTFGVIMRNPLIFLGLSFLIVALPQALVQLATGAATASSDPDAMMAMFSSPSMIAASAGGWLLVMILSILLQATFIIATVKDLNGQPVSLADCIAQAIGKFLPLIGLGIVMTLGIMAGMILLIIPGLILALMWIVASPVMMAEDKGIIDSLKRSAELTKGSKRWIVLLFVVYIILSMILGMLMIPFVFAGPIAIMLVGLVINTLTGAIQGTGIAAIYVDLRIVKEGGNSDALSDIFA